MIDDFSQHYDPRPLFGQRTGSPIVFSPKKQMNQNNKIMLIITFPTFTSFFILQSLFTSLPGFCLVSRGMLVADSFVIFHGSFIAANFRTRFQSLLLQFKIVNNVLSAARIRCNFKEYESEKLSCRSPSGSASLPIHV